jgi:hypothetical protein
MKIFPLAAYTFSHFAVDYLCFWILFGYFSAEVSGTAAQALGFILYNFIAFGLQMVIGAYCDEHRKFPSSALGCVLVLVAVLLSPFAPWVSLVTTALGNAFFHVGGGIESLVHSGGKLYRGGVFVSAGSLFSSVSPEVFAGTVETNLGIELSGYFIWNGESAEKIISKAGTFDYILPKNIKYSQGSTYVNLISGVQNMNGKKICDVIGYPKFSEAERCDIVSRMAAAFLNRRLKRFLPESGLYSVLFNYTETDITAFDKERYAKLVEVLCASGKSLSGHITNDTERSPETVLLYFSDSTKNRIIKYFG